LAARGLADWKAQGQPEAKPKKATRGAKPAKKTKTTKKDPIPLALIWFAHIGFDRLLGFGLKYPTRFKDTHLDPERHTIRTS
jgi:hypothetical protein